MYYSNTGNQNFVNSRQDVPNESKTFDNPTYTTSPFHESLEKNQRQDNTTCATLRHANVNTTRQTHEAQRTTSLKTNQKTTSDDSVSRQVEAKEKRNGNRNRKAAKRRWNTAKSEQQQTTFHGMTHFVACDCCYCCCRCWGSVLCMVRCYYTVCLPVSQTVKQPSLLSSCFHAPKHRKWNRNFQFPLFLCVCVSRMQTYQCQSTHRQQ